MRSGLAKTYDVNMKIIHLEWMNMLLRGVKDTAFVIYHGDTLTNDWD